MGEMTTPTPWTYEEALEGDEYSGSNALPINIRSADSWIVAAVAGDVPDLPTKANAALICRAVNAHAEMVEALKAAGRVLTQQNEAFGASIANNLALSKIRSALAKATGEEG